MVKTFLIANLAVVSVWIGPTTPCRALPSGFSSTPASLLVLPHTIGTITTIGIIGDGAVPRHSGTARRRSVLT